VTACEADIKASAHRMEVKCRLLTFTIHVRCKRPPLWSSGQSSWLLTQRFWVGFPALQDFLCSSGSGTGSIRPREDK
jgi:hypothetical protein